MLLEDGKRLADLGRSGELYDDGRKCKAILE